MGKLGQVRAQPTHSQACRAKMYVFLPQLLLYCAEIARANQSKASPSCTQVVGTRTVI